MEQLRDETNFTVHLSAPDNGLAVFLEKIEGPGMIRFNSYVGQRKRMNTSAVGKAISAYLPEDQLQLVFAQGLDNMTPNSITTETAYREHLKQIREFGYSLDDEEGEMGVRCIGVPIFMDGGIVFGAMSLSTLKGNLPMQKLSEFGNRLMQAAGEISRQLGYNGPYPLSKPE